MSLPLANPVRSVLGLVEQKPVEWPPNRSVFGGTDFRVATVGFLVLIAPRVHFELGAVLAVFVEVLDVVAERQGLLLGIGAFVRDSFFLLKG